MNFLKNLLMCPLLFSGGLFAETTDFKIVPRVLTEGYDRQTCWVQARAGIMPDGKVVLTLQKLTLTGSDIFDTIYSMTSSDGGKTFSLPAREPMLSRREVESGQVRCPSDATPQWHAVSGKLLLIAHTALYDRIDDGKSLKLAHRYDPGFVYAVYDERPARFGELKTVEFPPNDPIKIVSTGCVQRWDLPDGRILVPLSNRPDVSTAARDTVVVLCSFDGKTIKRIQSGQPVSKRVARGLYEPSLVGFKDKYYLTMRNDEKGYVAVSSDGLNYSEPVAWCWENGEEIGNYNTQQHWVRGGGKLYLVYTRRAENNGHVFRHRAPLFIAEVDPGGPNLIRRTERIVVPEHGARLGNFGITHLDDSESWVVVTEWMQSSGAQSWLKCENHGANNRLWLSRLTWNRSEENE